MNLYLKEVPVLFLFLSLLLFSIWTCIFNSVQIAVSLVVDRGRCGGEVVIFNTTKPWRVSEADRFSCCRLPWIAPSRELHSTGETMACKDPRGSCASLWRVSDYQWKHVVRGCNTNKWTANFTANYFRNRVKWSVYCSNCKTEGAPTVNIVWAL